MKSPSSRTAAGGINTGICSMYSLSHKIWLYPHFSDATVQAIFNEALKYQGWNYVYGGNNPNTSFDCSGLVQWCYGKAGISLPRTAQAQYDAVQHIPLSQAKAGDLVFFHSTYSAGTYVTHVGIYAGNKPYVPCRKTDRICRHQFLVLAATLHLRRTCKIQLRQKGQYFYEMEEKRKRDKT